MDLTHLHLLITHLPIFGSILGAFVLVNGLWTQSNQTQVAAYYLFIIASIGACISYLTGESAEETIENIQAVSESMVEQHEEAALFALIALIALGILSVIAVFFNAVKSRFSKPMSILILALSLISFGLVARTGYLGGQIRHTELVTSAASGNTNIDDD